MFTIDHAARNSAGLTARSVGGLRADLLLGEQATARPPQSIRFSPEVRAHGVPDVADGHPLPLDAAANESNAAAGLCPSRAPDLNRVLGPYLQPGTSLTSRIGLFHGGACGHPNDVGHRRQLRR
jgi:hypothetical protein